MTKPKEDPKKEYLPPKIEHEYDLETRAGSPCVSDPNPLDLGLPIGGNPCP